MKLTLSLFFFSLVASLTLVNCGGNKDQEAEKNAGNQIRGIWEQTTTDGKDVSGNNARTFAKFNTSEDGRSGDAVVASRRELSHRPPTSDEFPFQGCFGSG